MTVPALLTATPAGAALEERKASPICVEALAIEGESRSMAAKIARTPFWTETFTNEALQEQSVS